MPYDELVKRLRNEAETERYLLPHSDNGTAAILDEAADAIEELSKPRWIPVAERLPEPNAVDKYGFAKGYLVKTDRHVMMHTARYNGKWWILWGEAKVITDTVTHWMPLPEPPKEET